MDRNGHRGGERNSGRTDPHHAIHSSPVEMQQLNIKRASQHTYAKLQHALLTGSPSSIQDNPPVHIKGCEYGRSASRARSTTPRPSSVRTRITVDGTNLATLAGLLEDVQGYEAAIPAEQIVQALLRPQCLQMLLLD